MDIVIPLGPLGILLEKYERKSIQKIILNFPLNFFRGDLTPGMQNSRNPAAGANLAVLPAQYKDNLIYNTIPLLNLDSLIEDHTISCNV